MVHKMRSFEREKQQEETLDSGPSVAVLVSMVTELQGIMCSLMAVCV